MLSLRALNYLPVANLTFRIYAMKPLSNSEVAKVVGVHPSTLERWLGSGGLRWPKLLISGRRIVRLWSKQDVKRVRQYKAANCKNKKPYGPTLKIKRWQD
jgi:excisionase family DNA binding protein